MNKICKILSTIAIAVAILFVYIHIGAQNSVDKMMAFSQPSYYALGNYWAVFVSGIIALILALLCSFFSWLKKHDTVDILPNAGYSDRSEVNTWVKGTSLDTQTIDNIEVETKKTVADEQTEVANDKDDDTTEILSDEKTEVLVEESSDDVTEIIGSDKEAEDESDEDKTEIVQEGDK